MDKLWAPWRIKYLRAKKDKKCIFCNNERGFADKNLIFKTKLSRCVLNIFPYNNGHLMVAPARHTGDISLLKEEEALDLLKAVNRAKKLLDKVLKPHGYNIGINISESAGAGIPGHLHVHIVPRWKGDTNFMPVIYNTKILSQSLSELQKQLKNADSASN
ncbi:MAG: HIT domain-containing protein [Candidatus Omnitrophica bacterium]|nr:HIT domain-containing protein [Candidatus Omnitrophota bacterium]